MQVAPPVTNVNRTIAKHRNALDVFGSSTREELFLRSCFTVKQIDQFLVQGFGAVRIWHVHGNEKLTSIGGMGQVHVARLSIGGLAGLLR